MESVVTDLSVQMRPTLAVSPSMRPSQSQIVDGSAILSAPSAITTATPEFEVPVAEPSPSPAPVPVDPVANASPPTSGLSVSAKRIAIATRRRLPALRFMVRFVLGFMVSPPSSVPPPSTFLCACKSKALRAASLLIPSSSSPFRAAPPDAGAAHCACPTRRRDFPPHHLFPVSRNTRAHGRTHIRPSSSGAEQPTHRPGKTNPSYIRHPPSRGIKREKVELMTRFRRGISTRPQAISGRRRPAGRQEHPAPDDIPLDVPVSPGCALFPPHLPTCQKPTATKRRMGKFERGSRD